MMVITRKRSNPAYFFNGPYSSFRLKTRFWGQNDKALNNVIVTTDMAFVVGRYVLQVERKYYD